MENQFCIVIGRHGGGPLAILGPFKTSDEAEEAREPYPESYVDVLINPELARQAREGDL